MATTTANPSSSTTENNDAPVSTWLQDLETMYSYTRHFLTSPIEAVTGSGPTLNELTFGLLGSSFQPKRDIGDLSGKVVLVTGGNTGLGKETVLQLAHHNPKRIYLAARTESKARDAIASIQRELPSPADIRYIPLDLSSFASIKGAAEQFAGENERLDILVLNAGIMGQPAVTTPDGYEIQFGTNHVGHFLFTKLLLPVLSKTSGRPGADVRVVSLTSLASGTVPSAGADYLELACSTPKLLESSTWQRYAVSKAANILFAAELARRHPEIMSVSVHPGVVASDLYNSAQATHAAARYGFPVAKNLFLRDVPSGTLNQLWAAAGAKRTELVPGAYYTAVGHVSRRNRYATDQELARKLWEWTDQETEKAV